MSLIDFRVGKKKNIHEKLKRKKLAMNANVIKNNSRPREMLRKEGKKT
jgi:hypothetical protein